jgi:hypothetical protein
VRALALFLALVALPAFAQANPQCLAANGLLMISQPFATDGSQPTQCYLFNASNVQIASGAPIPVNVPPASTWPATNAATCTQPVPNTVGAATNVICTLGTGNLPVGATYSFYMKVTNAAQTLAQAPAGAMYTLDSVAAFTIAPPNATIHPR